MIEGKLGHHFQVDEMRHMASPACPAFTGCRSAERRCCSCTARPTCPAFTADKSTFRLKPLSARTGSSACPVYVVYEGAGKELVLIWQHLLQLIWAALLHCWVWMLSIEHMPPANSCRLGVYPPKKEQLEWQQHCPLPSHYPTSRKWQTTHNTSILKNVIWGTSISINFQRYPASKWHSQARAPGAGFWEDVPQVCQYSMTLLGPRCW